MSTTLSPQDKQAVDNILKPVFSQLKCAQVSAQQKLGDRLVLITRNEKNEVLVWDGKKFGSVYGNFFLFPDSISRLDVAKHIQSTGVNTPLRWKVWPDKWRVGFAPLSFWESLD